jgi:UDP-N-acetylmuramoyl-L-alanyl-D-glutamate--2,6-diaminopimelate ligase
MERDVAGLCFDSRKGEKSGLFVALRGTAADGHQFISTALAAGVTTIVAEELPEEKTEGITWIRVSDSSLALGIIAENFYDNPSQKLKVVAVTGTNGKTTVATLLYHLFTGLNYRCGLLSTVENRIQQKTLPASHTTPDAVQISWLMNEMVNAGCTHCFMEASSHAIHQNRMAGLKLSGAVFTNLSHDHLDYHKTFADYLAAKKKLFDGLPADAWALANADDRRGAVMLQNTKAKKFSFALHSPADFSARILETSFSGMILQLEGEEMHTPLVGAFNASNLLAIYAVARLLGEEKIPVLTVLSMLRPAEGRFDYVLSEKNRIMGIVDYAHTPDALEKMLITIGEIRTGNEKLITVVGCGGDRDAAKRPVMGKVASEHSDQVILTSDNPRSEDPAEILKQMMAGVLAAKSGRVISIPDRKEAIKAAVTLSGKGDIILLAGKGHEKYQEIKGVKHPFDDKQMLMESFRQLGK